MEFLTLYAFMRGDTLGQDVILKVEIQISDFSVQIGLLGVGQGDKNDPW